MIEVDVGDDDQVEELEPVFADGATAAERMEIVLGPGAALYGADAFLEKPLRLDELRHTLEGAMEASTQAATRASAGERRRRR